MEQQGCIYLITCLINNKKYVGQYKKPDPKGRWIRHILHSKKDSPLLLHRAIRLYGKENFKIDTLCICSHAALGNMEAYYAEQYECYMWDPEPGYNMVWCGKQFKLGIKNTLEANEKRRQTHLKLCRKNTPETIEKMRQAKLGKKRSLESIEKTRQAKLGKKHTPEHIEKVRQTKIGKKLSPESCEKKRQAMLAYYAKKREEAAASQK